MHIHMSTGMMLVSSVAILGTVGLCMWRGASKRRAAQEERDSQRAHEERMEAFRQNVKTWTPPAGGPSGYGALNPMTPRAPMTATPAPSYYNSTPTAPAPVVNHYHNNDSGIGGNGFLTGMLIGDMIGSAGNHGGTTIVENGGGHVVHDNSGYVDNGSFDSSSHDSGFTFDSGSSSSDSSGGFDFSSSSC